MFIPRTSHSATSVGNSQIELPREKHHMTYWESGWQWSSLIRSLREKSGRVISQYSIVQEPLKQPDVEPWLRSDFLTIILISAWLMIMSILDSFFFFKLALPFLLVSATKNFFLFFFFSFPPFGCSQAWRKSLQHSRPLLLESSPTSDPPTFS